MITRKIKPFSGRQERELQALAVILPEQDVIYQISTGPPLLSRLKIPDCIDDKKMLMIYKHLKFIICVKSYYYHSHPEIKACFHRSGVSLTNSMISTTLKFC